MKLTNTILVATLLLLPTILVTVSASDISLSNSIAVHTFDTLNGNNFVSHGKIIINNQDDNEIYINLYVIKELNALDKNITTGEPRIHSVVENVYFHEIPNIKWITVEEPQVVIPPKSSVSVNYTINIPKSELPSFVNKTNGFLCYIGVKEVHHNNPGANVGVNYFYKVFITFPIIKDNIYNNPIFIFILSTFITIPLYISIIFLKKIKIYINKKKTDDI